MSEFFLRLFNQSFAASWLIAAVILFRLFARKTPRWILCLLWGLVAVRLICPFSVESPLSLLPSKAVLPESILSESEPKLTIQTGVAPLDDSVNEYLGDTYFEGVSVPFDYGNSVMTAFGFIWICVLCAMLLAAALQYLHLKLHLREAVCFKDNLFFCDYVRSPFILGIIRPRIYLPSGITEEDLPHVIAHETAHLQRKDPLWKLLAFLLLCVYWFQPLCWAAFVLFCRDMETACDEKVIQDLNMAEKKAYLNALLSCSVKRKTVLISYPLSFGENGVKKRVKSILNYKKPTVWVISVSLLVCVIVGICFFTAPPEDNMMSVVFSSEDTETSRPSGAADGANQTASDASASAVNNDTRSFLGKILSSDTEKPGILIEGLGQSYEGQVYFVLPEELTEWTDHVGEAVLITCSSLFMPSDPPCGNLLDIQSAGISSDTSSDSSTYVKDYEYYGTADNGLIFLQETISADMESGILPFVVSCSVMPDCVKVGVAEEPTKQQLAILQSYADNAEQKLDIVVEGEAALE